MAASLSLSLSLSSDPQRNHRLPFVVSPPNPRHPLLSFVKSDRFSFRSSSHSSSPSATTESTSASTIYSSLEDSFKTGRFLSNDDLTKLKVLQDFGYYQELESGSMRVRVMRPEEMDVTVKLLAESFAESMLLPVAYVSVLRFLVKQYLVDRRDVLPHAATLIGFYRGKENEDEGELAGTVEVCFDKMGANSSPPTPTPPKNSPYICNMTVKKSLRRSSKKWLR